MAQLSEQQFREQVATLVLKNYFPRLTVELARYTARAYPRQVLAQSVSQIVGKPIGIDLGMFFIAEPTNDLIDSIVSLYVQQEKEKASK